MHLRVDDMCAASTTTLDFTKKGNCGKPALWQRRHGAAAPKLTSLCLNNPDKQALKTPISGGCKSFTGFDIQRSLGHGALCAVHLARRRSDGEQVALKVMRTEDPEVRTTAEKEFSLLRSFDHPNIVRAQDYWVDGGCAVIVLDYFECTTLDAAVRGSPSGSFSEAQSKHLTACLLEAVDYIHKRRVVHRDIKPSNVLVSPGLGNLKLVDFNAAATIGISQALSPTGTRTFAAPEVISGGPPAESNDTWTVGVCLYFMLAGMLPQRRGQCHSISALRAAAKQPVDLTEPRFDKLSTFCKTFLGRCLCIEAYGRPAPMTLLEDRWLKGTEKKVVRFGRQQPSRATRCTSEEAHEDSDDVDLLGDSSEDDEPMMKTKSVFAPSGDSASFITRTSSI